MRPLEHVESHLCALKRTNNAKSMDKKHKGKNHNDPNALAKSTHNHL